MSTPQSEIEKHLETLKRKIKNTVFVYEEDREALTFFIGVGERMTEENISKILNTTKLGKGHNFSDSTDYDLYLHHWKIGKKELLLLAHSILNELGGGGR